MRFSGFLVMMLLTATVFSPAQGAGIETMVMPGPVIDGHAEWEDQCRECHAPFSKQLQRNLCLACHEEINADITQGEGYHGRFEPAAEAECKNCHTEHLGRDADVTGLDRDTFDHSLADFELRDAHLVPSCTGCHESGVKHRETPNTCVGCHQDDDAHAGNLGDQCGDCHSETRWLAAQFDHAEETQFALTGKHAQVACGDCHRDQQYENTPTECVACHRIDDVHQGRNGDDCSSCHVTDSWAELKFDHLSETGFALADGHAGLVCEACHVSGDTQTPIDADCYACHRNDDEHQGRNGEDCESCHRPTRWADTEFDHGTQTEFPLVGAHEPLPCTDCHKAAANVEALETACVSCHGQDDPHKEQLGSACNDCHNEQGWVVQVRFNHDLTAFPLIGLHATVPCAECHSSRTFHDTGSACVDCHQNDDSHNGALGNECGRCHHPNDWGIWAFDHDNETDFPLEGAHAGLACEGCHRRPAADEVALPDACGSCHRRDDIHLGQFGSDCARCHTTESFSDVRGL